LYDSFDDRALQGFGHTMLWKAPGRGVAVDAQALLESELTWSDHHAPNPQEARRAA
jgi:hypothetical protein